MAIAKNPKRNQTAKTEQEAQSFISGASSANSAVNSGDAADAKFTAAQSQDPPSDGNKKPVMIRIDAAMIERIDRAAKRLGLSRSAFVVLSAAERLERMESENQG